MEKHQTRKLFRLDVQLLIFLGTLFILMLLYFVVKLKVI